MMRSAMLLVLCSAAGSLVTLDPFEDLTMTTLAHTPNGLWPTRCLHHVPVGTHISKAGGDGLTLVHANGSTATLSPCEGAPSLAPRRFHNASTTAEDTHSYPVIYWGSTDQPIASMNGTYVVPSTPKVRGANTVHWWFGAEDAKGSVVVQPVLTWTENYNDRWAIGSWNCCPAGHQFYGSLFWVNVGETVTGSIISTGGTGYEVVTTTVRGERSVLTFDDNLNFTQPLLSLETYNTSADCAMLPASRMIMKGLRTSPVVDSWGENDPSPPSYDITSRCGWDLEVNQTSLVATPP